MKHAKKMGAGAVLAAVAAIAVAQQAGFTRTPLQDQEISDPAKHVVQVRAEFQPGVAAGRHTHPGEEFGYVLDGTIVLEIDGKPPVTLNAGQVFFVPAGMVHDGRNVGKGSATVIATYVVEKGKPVASPAK